MGRKDETIELEKVTYQRQGLVGEIATGFYGVIWTVTHPGKTLLRGFGIVGGISAVWFFGELWRSPDRWPAGYRSGSRWRCGIMGPRRRRYGAASRHQRGASGHQFGR